MHPTSTPVPAPSSAVAAEGAVKITPTPNVPHDWVQKAAKSRASCGLSEPLRCIERHSNHISGNGVDYTATAWYVRMEDNTLHGQFQTEATAIHYAQTQELGPVCAVCGALPFQCGHSINEEEV